MQRPDGESKHPTDDLTPEEERWCEDFFRNLFPEDDDEFGSNEQHDA
jgi:hypothetical protein